MSIRPYSETDLPTIIDIYSLSKLDELRFEATPFELLPLPQDAKRYQLFNQSDVYVYDAQSVVAYVALFDAEIRSLYVHPDSRGQGIGKQLLEFSLSIMPKDTYLYIVKSNHLAKKLYLHYGFKVTEEFETNYNGRPVQANKMQRFQSGIG